jgi:single-stranded-DNA-specific exonuclease
MKDAAVKVADRLRRADDVLIISHIDADGISAAGVASSALDSMGIEHDVKFTKKLDQALVDEVVSLDPDLVWFIDLGSGSTDILGGLDCVITDHHVPTEVHGGNKKTAKTLFDFGDEGPTNRFLQVNPHLSGLDGSGDISGAGTAYLVARELDDDLKKLAFLAIVGAVGDMQDRADGRLVGTNRDILADGEEAGVVEVIEDLNMFGRETRPVHKMLQYSSDLKIPGVTDDYEGSMQFLMELEIDLKRGEDWRMWVDLRKAEKSQVIAALSRLVSREELIGEVYLFPNEKEGTPLHEAKEFSTLLNSCGRYDSAELGLAVCKGDRKESLDLALGLRRGHKKLLVESMGIMLDVGIREMDNIQHVHTGGMIRDTIVGTVAGMLLGSGKVKPSKPIFAMAEADDGIKVSGRGTKELVDRGLDLSEVMNEATEKLDGVGGGHNIAAGATIQPEQVDEFLELADGIVGKQLKKLA